MNHINKKPRVGVGVMILKDSKVLLGKRHVDLEKAGSELHGEDSWTMPGGKVDFHEELRDAVSRETFEETEIKINKEKLQIISVTSDMAQDVHFVTIGFFCKDFKGEPKVMEPDEITEWKWFDLNNLPTPIFPPSEKILKKYFEKQTNI